MSNESKCHRNAIEAGKVKKGSHVILEGRPCKIITVTIAKTGKHGHMKVTMTGIDVFTSAKYVKNVPGHVTVMQFELEKKEYLLTNIEDNLLEYLDEKNNSLVLKIIDSDVIQKLKKEMNDPSNSEKQYLVTIIRAPVEKSKDMFVDEELVESFREDSKD